MLQHCVNNFWDVRFAVDIFRNAKTIYICAASTEREARWKRCLESNNTLGKYTMHNNAYVYFANTIYTLTLWFTPRMQNATSCNQPKHVRAMCRRSAFDRNNNKWNCYLWCVWSSLVCCILWCGALRKDRAIDRYPFLFVGFREMSRRASSWEPAAPNGPIPYIRDPICMQTSIVFDAAVTSK